MDYRELIYVNKLDLLQIESILENIFKNTVSQKLFFRIHQRLLNRFWKAMEQNIRLYFDTLENEADLLNSMQRLLDDIRDLL